MAGQVETLTSASGLISLLDEEEHELQYYGLTQLEAVADRFWTEISDSITKIEVLYEDETFKHRQLAALVASKIYFHLGEFDDALNFALGAGELFRLEDTSAYVQTVVNHAIDKYIEVRSRDGSEAVDGRLEFVVERMVERCFETKEYGQAIGISIEAQRLDILKRALESGDTRSLLAYVQRDCIDLISNIHVQSQVQELVVSVLLQFAEPDYEAICLGLSKLNNPEKTAGILQLLAQGDEDKVLSAYQIAFDLNSNATQEFTKAVANELAGKGGETKGEAEAEALDKIQSILSGDETPKLHLEFLFRNNKTDMFILNRTCKMMDSRLSLAHSAVSFANAFMHAGTTVDNFLRENLEWLSRANNWSKFTATAAFGVIHHGHVKHSFNLLQPYLPEDNSSVSPYSEGGAFFALGLIHACHGTDKVTNYLRDALTAYQGPTAEILQHGACLGLGTAGMGSGSEDVAQALMSVLYTDSAVAGEAAGIGLGLVMMGSSHEATLKDMLVYAKDTEHEKIIRSLSVGIGLIMFGRKQEADPLIERLLEEEDPLLRLGAVHTITMAYCGTGDNNAIRKLLHLAVSDVKDDVRRAAVTGLGFVLLRSPEQVPRMVELLSESFNPHVRAGAALALGIACAGSGSKAAIAILEPMVKDSVDFVVESASISLAFILIQQNDTYDAKVGEVRKRYSDIIETKHAEGVTKFGAAISQGIIDAGGRNVSIGLTTNDGQLNMAACGGMLLFTQFWYWFPLAHFLALAFKPTALIAINKDLKAPKLDAVCLSRKALFAYPAAIEQPAVVAPTKIATAVLSTTAKAKRIGGGGGGGGGGSGGGSGGAKKGEGEEEAKKAEGGSESMETESSKEHGALAASAGEEGMDVDEGSDGKQTKKMRKGGGESFGIGNLTRLLPYQEKFVKWPSNSRYVAVKQGAISGVLLVKDTTPGKPEDFIASMLEDGDEGVEEVSPVTAATTAALSSSSGGEAQQQPPESFEYPFDEEASPR